MTSSEIRQSFLDFFKSKQHTIVPSSSLMPDAPNLLFTNAGMNQFVPIFLGQIESPYQPGRAADTQKCIRAGGKHNDLEDVGLDTYHHTFFEMLGNWSFGDYFKKEAIEWAWELLTSPEWWGMPKERLYATVYSPNVEEGDPGAFDQEAYDIWAPLFEAAGLDPKIHIVHGSKADNFWMMGETGPCGPCSEVHIDLTPDGSTKGKLVNAGSADCIEIWNLVFIQLNANADGSFSPLPAKHVDTGMGFERVTSIIQGTKKFSDFKRLVSNYETDIFRPIFDELEKLSGKKYGSTLPEKGRATGEQEQVDIAFRVIGDHIRTLSFAIADGILPGNTGRNYVLRRILRRAVRYGRTLGFTAPFFYKLVNVLAKTMGDVFPEVRAKQAMVESTIRGEEESFNKTLDRGIELFKEEAARLGQGGMFSGEFAFKLYDTYGFPLDLTQLMAREEGFGVDSAGFDVLMEEQKARARAAQKKEVISVSTLDTSVETRFVGYEQWQARGEVLEVVEVKGRSAVILDVSPCYAAMGGQVGDMGVLVKGDKSWRISDTQKVGGAFLHFLDGEEAPSGGSEVEIRVEEQRRRAIQRHHTVTHLFHWALHEVVGMEATQKGSYVGPEKLTFDFNASALSAAQVRDIERLVNERVLENQPVSWRAIPYSEAKERKDILQFFGDKYGDEVRVVQIGGGPGELNGYSMELCGGTHTLATGEIGLFRILSESAVAAGTRRIEAVAGVSAYEWARGIAETLSGLAGKVNSPLGELEKKIDSMLQRQREIEKELKASQQRQAVSGAKELIGRRRDAGGTPVLIEDLGEVDGDYLQAVADALKNEFEGITVLAGAIGETVALVATVSPAYVKKAQAGKLIQAIAPIVGGRGGGRPEQARGGGKDPGKIREALAKAMELAQ